MLLLDDTALACLLKRDGAVAAAAFSASGRRARMVSVALRARGSGIVCGTEEAARMFALLGCAADTAIASGTRAEPGALLIAARGPAEALVGGAQAVQTLLEWASGVADCAARILRATRAVNPAVAVACPRKAIPGARPLALKAVAAGGAAIYPALGAEAALVLSDCRALGGRAAPGERIAGLRQAAPAGRVTVEVRDGDEALAAARLGADRLLLARMAPDAVAATMRALGPGWPGEALAAGPITEGAAPAYAKSGVHALVSSAPYHALPAEIDVAFEPG
ncbi:beta/alpha barrel domain-containing protein [Rhodovulum sulfidophilum]|uniref:quinolinate phosphoribosyl transferase n=2 Tax=Rhodovulum sulfidophilum TaxID=35806 RepID=UPI001F1DE747|nr:quinolinate phosphoribosyl transferase [Rhodovulum sulfidophilum]MCE8431137.1 quinolinate phosphoribosyl transferase [Rhodovulum sulfidophilum]